MAKLPDPSFLNKLPARDQALVKRHTKSLAADNKRVGARFNKAVRQILLLLKWAKESLNDLPRDSEAYGHLCLEIENTERLLQDFGLPTN